MLQRSAASLRAAFAASILWRCNGVIVLGMAADLTGRVYGRRYARDCCLDLRHPRPEDLMRNSEILDNLSLDELLLAHIRCDKEYENAAAFRHSLHDPLVCLWRQRARRDSALSQLLVHFQCS